MGRTEGLLAIAGLVVLGLGIARFAALGHFSLGEAGYCLIAAVVAVFLLFVADYTLHHARVAMVIVVLLIAALAWRSPAFCVGLGVALLLLLAEQRSR